jgi:hypothetical protein
MASDPTPERDDVKLPAWFGFFNAVTDGAHLQEVAREHARKEFLAAGKATETAQADEYGSILKAIEIKKGCEKEFEARTQELTGQYHARLEKKEPKGLIEGSDRYGDRGKINNVLFGFVDSLQRMTGGWMPYAAAKIDARNEFRAAYKKDHPDAREGDITIEQNKYVERQKYTLDGKEYDYKARVKDLTREYRHDQLERRKSSYTKGWRCRIRGCACRHRIQAARMGETGCCGGVQTPNR